MDIRQNATLCNCDMPKELIQFLVVSDGELQMARDYTSLLIVACSITSQLEDFGRKVFKNSSKIDRGT
jgi:hypothetical protein